MAATTSINGMWTSRAENMPGRRGPQSPINTMRTPAQWEGRHPVWQLMGWMGILTSFLILTIGLF